MYYAKIVKSSMILATLFAIGVVFAAPSAHAASKTWTGTANDGQFSTAGNWSPSGAPASGDSLTFNVVNDGLARPENDMNNLTIGSITVQGTSPTTLYNIKFSKSTTIAGNITATNPKGVTLEGGFTLGSNITVDGDVDLADTTPATNVIALNSHSLNFTNVPAGIVSVGTKISGSGTVSYNNVQRVYIAKSNDYSGNTAVSNHTNVSNTSSPSTSRNPSQLFGVSAISIDGTSTVEFEFTTASIFPNPIALSATEVTTTGNNTSFRAQVDTQTNGLAVGYSGIVLNGKAGFGVSSQTTSVNLAGIQANGNCAYYQTVYQDKYLNGPTSCIAGSSSGATSTPIPGTPKAGNEKSLAGITRGVLIFATGIVAMYFIRKLTIKKLNS